MLRWARGMVVVGQLGRPYRGEDNFLDTLFEVRFGKKPVCPRCRQVGKFRRRHKQKAYSCVACGHDIYPLVELLLQWGSDRTAAWPN